MSLQANLDEYKANFNKTAPADVQKTMHQAAEELQNSRILDRVLKKAIMQTILGHGPWQLDSLLTAMRLYDTQRQTRTTG